MLHLMDPFLERIYASRSIYVWFAGMAQHYKEKGHQIQYERSSHTPLRLSIHM